MPGTGKEPLKATSPRSEKSRAKESERDNKLRISVENRRNSLSTAERAAETSVVERVQEHSGQLDVQIEAQSRLDVMTARGVDVPPSTPANAHPEVQSTARQAAESVGSAGKQRTVRNYVAKHVFSFIAAGNSLAALLVSASSLGVSITTLVVNLANLNAGKVPRGMSEKDQALLKEALQRWQDRSDADFWKEVGKLVDDVEMPLQTQQLMCTLLDSLCKPATFAWAREGDKLDAVYKLVDAYRARLESKAMYDALADFAYVRDPAKPKETEALPRKEANSVLYLALQRVIVLRSSTTAAA